VRKPNGLLAAELKELGGLGTDALRQRWTELFGIAPTPRISKELLIRAVAYQIQEKMHGGLGKACRRQLQRLAETLREGSIPSLQGAYSTGSWAVIPREGGQPFHGIVGRDSTPSWAP
jgi:hypothetical protein